MIWTLQIKEKLKTLMKKFIPYGYLFPCVKFQGIFFKTSILKSFCCNYNDVSRPWKSK
jgi:hypothetical protein